MKQLRVFCLYMMLVYGPYVMGQGDVVHGIAMSFTQDRLRFDDVEDKNGEKIALVAEDAATGK